MTQKNQWIQELVLQKDKQDWQTFSQTHQEKKIADPINKITNERREITTDTKEIQKIIKKTLCTIICQQTGQPGWNA